MFGLELMFMLPWCVNVAALSIGGYTAMVGFIVILGVEFVYVGVGALNIKKMLNNRFQKSLFLQPSKIIESLWLVMSLVVRFLCGLKLWFLKRFTKLVFRCDEGEFF